jgi:putative DNA primase/helicase
VEITLTFDVDINLEAAAYWALDNGFAPVPLHFKSKRPTLPEWQHLRIHPDDVRTLFGQRPVNIGLLCGEASGNLTDLDLESPLASLVADLLVPQTDMVSGRRSNPRAHRRFLTDPLAKSRHWRDLLGKMLLEIRADKTQTMVPPSIHPDDERVEWYRKGRPPTIPGDVLERAAGQVAAALVLAHRWPEHNRHHAALALAGGLLRRDWELDDVERFVRAVCLAAHDEEVDDRLRTIRDTAAELRAGETKVTGWPRLAELVGADTVTLVRDYLGVQKVAMKAPEPGTALTDLGNAERLVLRIVQVG